MYAVYSLTSAPVPLTPLPRSVLDSTAYPFVVSRKHMTVHRAEDGSWIATDLGSKNGVIVNGVRVQTATLRPGDRVMIGGAANVAHGARTNPLTDLAYVFQAAGEAFAPSPAALAPPPMPPVPLVTPAEREKRKGRDADSSEAKADAKAEKAADEPPQRKTRAEKKEEPTTPAGKDKADKAATPAAAGKAKSPEENKNKDTKLVVKEEESASSEKGSAKKRGAAARKQEEEAVSLATAKRRVAQKWVKGDEVEAKCQNPDVPEGA